MNIPGRMNLVLAMAIVAIFACSLIVMPVVMGRHVWAMVAITLLLLPLNTPLWSLIHEAIHKNFHANKKINEIAGRVMAVAFGAGFGVLRFGHLMHHQYNRDWENEYYTGNKFIAWVSHYFKMLGGLYGSEVAASFMLALFPAPLSKKIARRVFADDQHYAAVLNSMLKPENVRKLRTDCLWIALFYGLSFMAYGTHWGIAVLAIAGRGVIISLMDNAYHYGTPADGSVVAKELQTAPVLAKFILNFNHHVTHHKNVRVPWTALAEQHEAQDNAYTQKLGTAMLEQFKGPIEMKDQSIRR